MLDENVSTPIVAIVGAGSTLDQITTTLNSQPEFQPLILLESMNGWVKKIREAQPDIILIDHAIGGQPTLEIIDDISLQFPDVAIVAILPDDNPINAQKALMAGARAFVTQPFTQMNLMNSLRRIRELESRRRISHVTTTGENPKQSDSMNILTVYSPRGGVGCSTLALNLALALHVQTESRVLLFEGKQLFGHLGLMLNIRAHNDLTDLIPHAGALDPGLVEDVVTKHASGIDVLLRPKDIQAAQGVRPEDLLNIVRGVRNMYAFIVIDAGSHLNENTVTLMDLSDKILLVTTPDLAALHDISRFVNISRTLAYAPGKLLTILNRSNMMGGVKFKEIQNTLHHEVFAQIPDDETKVLHSLNRGVPLLYKYPRSPVSKSIRKIAKTLVGIGVGEEFGKSDRKPTFLPKIRSRLATPRTG